LTLQRSVDSIVREGGETTKIFQVNLERQRKKNRKIEIAKEIEIKTEKERKLSKVM
jgi:hypothetical protein